jgi:Methyltransferase domain
MATEPKRTATYWETRYGSGGNSGAGSYGHLAIYKAHFLNRFVRDNRIHSVGELGCGDGAQLTRALYPAYIGYDISPTAIKICRERHSGDQNKKFVLLSDAKSLVNVDLGLSLDVVYHLLEDDVYEEHLRQLFRMASRFVIIYGNGCVKPYSASHVRLHDFHRTVGSLFSKWRLVNCERNPFYSETGTDPSKSWSNFYVYKAPERALHMLLASAAAVSEARPQSLMTTAEFKAITVAQWRSRVRDPKIGALVEVAVGDVEQDLSSSPAIAGGYVQEVLPQLQPLPKSTQQNTWMGVLQRSPALIVSMTTIKSRLKTLSAVLDSILNQSLAPARINLNISSDPYLKDEGIREEDLPIQVKNMELAGMLKINFVANTGPFRKLLPTLRDEWDRNSVIVTADDDTLYPPFWLEEMFETYISNDTIVARRCNRMRIGGGKPLAYLDWAKSTSEAEIRPEFRNLFIFPTGKDGVLYHPKFFTEAVFDPQLIKIAPTADDLVFKLASMMTKTPVTPISRKLYSSGTLEQYPEIEGSDGGLWMQNQKGINDASLTALLAYMTEKKLLDLRQYLI